MEAKSTSFKRGIYDGIPIALGYIAVSFTFGIMAENAGLTVFQAALMSLTNLTSAGQFAALGLISSAVPYTEMMITQLIINLRYCLMSGALSQKLDRKTPLYHKLLIAHGISDEIFGVSIVQDKLTPAYSYGVISVAVPGWTIGTLLGIAAGNLLSPHIISALSVSLYGMFLAIILPPAKENRVILGLIVISMLLSLMTSLIPLLSTLSSGTRIIILTLLIAGTAAFLFPVPDSATEILPAKEK